MEPLADTGQSPEARAVQQVHILYGTPIHNVRNANRYAEMVALSKKAREALAVLATPAGKAYAKKVGLRATKITEVKA